MLERVNPDVLKAAADLIYWEAHVAENGQVLVEDGVPGFGFRVFDPLTSDADAMKLEDYLERNGWMFRHNGKSYIGEHDDFWSEYRGYQPIEAETKAMRALACVAATTGLPMGVGRE